LFTFHHFRAAFNSLILLLGSEHAFGQSPRLEPACHEERLAMDSVKAEILAYQLGATSEVPGNEIMAVSYWGAHWRKHETSEIYRTAKYRWPLGQVYAIRKRVEIHFMVNVATKEVRQVKFKNTIEQGCEGEIEWPWVIRSPASTTDPREIEAGLSRRGQVTVGPVTPVEHPRQGSINCATCHGGAGLSALNPKRLKTPPHRFSPAAAMRSESPSL
jgi:hypothetical protein